MIPGHYRRFIWCAVLLAAVMAVGTAGYWFIGGGRHTVLDTFYMTFITIATIGYGEIIDLSNSPAGRVFTMAISVAGIGVLAYAVTNLSAVLVEGNLSDSFRRRRMESKAKNSRGHLIVCGIGAIGKYIAGELLSTKRDFVLVETSREKAERAMASFKNAVVIEGDATNNEVLLKAGIGNASGLFASTGDDNQNLVISLSAKQLNPGLRVVAECNDVANSDKMKKAGADAVVSPGLIGGLRMASEMIRPTVVSFLDTMLRDTDRNLRVEEIGLHERFAGKTVADLGLKSFRHSLLLAVKTQRDWVYNPPDDHVINPHSVIVIMTTPEDRSALERGLT